jgi:Protein of unknown function (DUF2844)
MKSILQVLLILILLTLGTAPAWAVLGQYESSVSLDQKYMKSVDRVQNVQRYVVHQLTSENGTIVREYVSPNGMVFGVSWQGRFMPNLQQLLGSYITKIQTAKRTQTQIRHLRGVIVKTDDFVFANSGHMRFWTGTAYVPSLVPSNVSPEVVR